MLEIHDLTKRYRDVVALDGATFSVAPGRIVGFLGPNGPDRGEILWKGKPVGLPERARFGYMPEERGLYPKMRIGDELIYFAELSGMRGTAA